MTAYGRYIPGKRLELPDPLLPSAPDAATINADCTTSLTCLAAAVTNVFLQCKKTVNRGAQIGDRVRSNNYLLTN